MLSFKLQNCRRSDIVIGKSVLLEQHGTCRLGESNQPKNRRTGGRIANLTPSGVRQQPLVRLPASTDSGDSQGVMRQCGH